MSAARVMDPKVQEENESIEAHRNEVLDFIRSKYSSRLSSLWTWKKQPNPEEIRKEEDDTIEKYREPVIKFLKTEYPEDFV
jgi:hypothetical protein